jgi:hypothetical protein
VRVLRHIGQRLGHREIDGRGDRQIDPFGQVDVHHGGQRCVQRQRPDGIAQAAVGQHRRVDAAHQVAQFGQGTGGALLGLADQGEGGLGIGGEEPFGRLQAHPDGDPPIR